MHAAVSHQSLQSSRFYKSGPICPLYSRLQFLHLLVNFRLFQIIVIVFEAFLTVKLSFVQILYCFHLTPRQILSTTEIIGMKVLLAPVFPYICICQRTLYTICYYIYCEVQASRRHILFGSWVFISRKVI